MLNQPVGQVANGVLYVIMVADFSQEVVLETKWDFYFYFKKTKTNYIVQHNQEIIHDRLGWWLISDVSPNSVFVCTGR